MNNGTGERVPNPVPILLEGIGTRISAACDVIGTRKNAAIAAGVSVDSLARYIREENMPPFDVAARLCAAAGLDMGWLATGVESAEATPQVQSHAVRRESLKMAVQLAQEALDGRYLEPADYAELVDLIYDALVNGLPSAQVLAFARPAARGIGLKGVGNAESVDKSGAPTVSASK